MSKIGYVLRMAKAMNFTNLRKRAGEASKKSGRPVILIVADMLYCALRYQAGYMDYTLFEMYFKNRRQRESVLTRGKNNMYVAALNDSAASLKLSNKVEFHKYFAAYTKRAYLDLATAGFTEFEAFIDTYGDILVKPPGGTHGEGIRRLPAGEITDRRALYDECLKNGRTLCEQLVVQHDELNRVYAGSVNTIRLVTMLVGMKAEIVIAMHRIGGAGNGVDNFNSGGMVAPVDDTTGRVTLPAVDKQGNVYASHPATGGRIAGMQIPYWNECLEIVKNAALVVPEVRYIGWDVAVTPAGPLLIEGNPYPGHDIYGLPAHSPDGMGVLPRFEAVIPLKDLRKLKK